MPPTTTQQQVIDYVERRLGSPTVQIELTVDQLVDCVEDGVRLFDRYLHLSEFQVLTEQTGSIAVDWPVDVEGVLYCVSLMPQSYQMAERASVFELMFRLIPGRLPVGEWYEMRSFYEMYKRVRGTDPSWTLDRENRKLHVDCRSGPYDVFIVWAKDATLASLLTGSQTRWKDDFLKVCLAFAKERLAVVRGKFGGVPAPGGPLTTDAERFAREAAETLKTTELRLARRARAGMRPQFG